MDLRTSFRNFNRRVLLFLPCAFLAAPLRSDPGLTDASLDRWLPGTARCADGSALNTKYFTPEFILDMNFADSLNRPVDHVIDASLSDGRSDEFQLQQFGVGGDLHFDDGQGGVLHGRLMTAIGMESQLLPRDDASPDRGSPDLGLAYQYVTEANGGYHWPDLLHGVNLDAGIFPSYMGLYSLYTPENWTTQAAFPSSELGGNVNGLRLQVFPTASFKSEWWLINGWQSYGMFNDKLALGFQQRYSAAGGAFCLVSNGYAGFDAPDSPDLLRLHSDSSLVWKDYQAQDPRSMLYRNAWSLSADIGGTQGDLYTGCGTCPASTPDGYQAVTMGPGPNEEAFFGAMLYNRTWFTDKFAFTFGGGFVNNPGQYLLLLPPVVVPTGSAAGQAATAADYAAAANFYNAEAYSEGFAKPVLPTLSPGAPFVAENFQIAFDYMPTPFLLYRLEFDSAQANIPYYNGPGGMSGPDGWNANVTGGGPGNPPVFNPQPGTTPTFGGSAGTAWLPDLVKSEQKVVLAMEIEI
jgi:Putative beta-barrel porin-2, OmpL-like. bbp2